MSSARSNAFCTSTDCICAGISLAPAGSPEVGAHIGIEYLVYLVIFAAMVYRWMFTALLPDAPSTASVFVAATSAQVGSALMLRLVERLVGASTPHSEHCRLWTVCYSTMAALGVDTCMYTAALVAFCTAVLVPRSCLWFPSKVPIRVEDLRSIARQTATTIQEKLAALGDRTGQMHVTCDYLGEFSDRVRSADGRTIVKTTRAALKGSVTSCRRPIGSPWAQ